MKFKDYLKEAYMQQFSAKRSLNPAGPNPGITGKGFPAGRTQFTPGDTVIVRQDATSVKPSLRGKTAIVHANRGSGRDKVYPVEVKIGKRKTVVFMSNELDMVKPRGL